MLDLFAGTGHEGPMTRTCLRCQVSLEGKRTNAKYCSVACGEAFRDGRPRERACRHCGALFAVGTRADANRQHCSRACAKAHNGKTVKAWHAAHPEAVQGYRATQHAKTRTKWQGEYREKRLAIIALLGGACVVCGATNPVWLHVDYIPTNRESPYRHPRHFRYVQTHRSLFRLLCANHHYELTLTGRIEGSDLTQ